MYHYAGAASRTAGSQSPLASFALAAGNANPQRIADPPAQRTIQYDSRRASISSPGPAAKVSRALGSDVAFLVRLADSAPIRKSAAVLARQQVFESFAWQLNYPLAWRAPQREDPASETDLPELRPRNSDDQAADDLAFASVFMSVV